MKNHFYLCFLIGLFACNQSTPKTATKEASTVNFDQYPMAMQKIFAAHGSLETWQKMQAMTYEMVDSIAGNEKQWIDLHNRRERIEAPTFKTGYDGTSYWLEADTSYDGNPVFYHNLMFYFYAMPFVLADDGIIYSETDTLFFEEQSYPGIRISYNDGVGISPKDEYFIYYDATTYEMAWLAYTVTYFSGQKSDRLGWIRYDDWKKINGLLLPNSLTWYKSEESQPTQARKTRNFINVTVSETAHPDKVFAKTPESTIVEQ